MRTVMVDGGKTQMMSPLISMVAEVTTATTAVGIIPTGVMDGTDPIGDLDMDIPIGELVSDMAIITHGIAAITEDITMGIIGPTMVVITEMPTLPTTIGEEETQITLLEDHVTIVTVPVSQTEVATHDLKLVEDRPEPPTVIAGLETEVLCEIQDQAAV